MSTHLEPIFRSARASSLSEADPILRAESSRLSLFSYTTCSVEPDQGAVHVPTLGGDVHTIAEDGESVPAQMVSWAEHGVLADVQRLVDGCATEAALV